MRMVALTNSSLAALVDDADFDKVSAYSWHLHRDGYAAASPYSNGVSKRVYMHRLVKQGLLVDHRDRNKLNNRQENLRPATRRQNGGNRAKDGLVRSSRHKGVCWDKQYTKWVAYIKDQTGKVRKLGRFVDETKAAEAYNAAALAVFGEFALLNST